MVKFYHKPAGLAAIVFSVVALVFKPVLLPNNPQLWILVAVSLATGWAFAMITAELAPANPRSPRTVYPAATAVKGGALVFGMLLVVAMVTSVVQSDTRRDVSGLLSAAPVSALPELADDQVPLVSATVALKALSRKLGEDLGLGSQFEIGTPVKQMYKGKLVWVAPLEPKSMLKALLGTPAPAYGVVSATDVSDVELVRKVSRISDRQWLGLDARVWFSNPTLAIANWAYELDEAGNPFWVGSLFERKATFQGKDVYGAVLINAATGVKTVYDLKSVPAWVDNLYSANMISYQIAETGELVNGWLNLSDEGRFKLSGDLDMVIVDDQPWFIGTLSSQGRTEAITEAILVSPRTKELKRFTLPGITEGIAAKAMENQNPEKHLVASNPVLYQVNGNPAYVSALADNSGVIRAYGVVAAQDAQVLAVGETLSGVIKQFGTRSGRAKAALTVDAVEKEVKGTVLVIRQEAQSQQYFMLIQTSKEKLIVAAAPHLTEQLHVTTTGNSVRLKIKASGESWIASEFENSSL